jgi:Protein of unknown function (DUF1697)
LSSTDDQICCLSPRDQCRRTYIIKMTDLKRIFESLGLENVQTYIQSGNVIFESNEDDTVSLEKQIERQIETAVSYKTQLFVRTIQEVQSLPSKSPFTAEANETVHVTFLNEKPDKKQQQALISFKAMWMISLAKGAKFTTCGAIERNLSSPIISLKKFSRCLLQRVI